MNKVIVQEQQQQIQIDCLTEKNADIGLLYDFSCKTNQQNKFIERFRTSLNHWPRFLFFYRSTEHIQKIVLEKNKFQQSAFEQHGKHQLLFAMKLVKKKEIYCFEVIKGSSVRHIDSNVELIKTKGIPYRVVRLHEEGLELKKDQYIQLGAVEYKLLWLKIYDNNSCIKEGVQKILPQTRILKIKKDQQMQFKQCRYCYESDESQNNFLFQSCKCSGSNAFVHLICLQKWITVKIRGLKKENNYCYYFSRLTCQTCLEDYPIIIQYEGKSYNLLSSILVEKGNFIALKPTDPKKGQRLLISEPIDKKIGRNKQNDIVLEQQTVSRRHCEFVSVNNKIHIKDRNSTYGTLISYQNQIIPFTKSKQAFKINKTLFVFQLVSKKNQNNAE